jgi:hypothetical protein
MRDRRTLPWMLGLGLVAVVTIGLAIGVNWWGADLTAQAYTFYSSTNSDGGISQAEYDYWNTISTNGYTLQSLATPLLTGSLAAVLTLLAVLARRWDLAHRAAQDEATAAS